MPRHSKLNPGRWVGSLCQHHGGRGQHGGVHWIRFQYHRQLLGLDGADEFRARWFNGTSWITVEQTGAASANDSAYVLRSFRLPAGAANAAAFAIRFECAAGAVSECCNVDDVIVTAGP